MMSTGSPLGQSKKEIAALCQKLIELNLLCIVGDESVDRERVSDEIVDIAERLVEYRPVPTLILATGYAQLWIEGCQQTGTDPLAAWQLRHPPPDGG